MAIPQAISKDWNDREFLENVQFSVMKICTFLNRFERSTRYRLAKVDKKLLSLERKMDFLDQALRNADPANPAPLDDPPEPAMPMYQPVEAARTTLPASAPAIVSTPSASAGGAGGSGAAPSTPAAAKAPAASAAPVMTEFGMAQVLEHGVTLLDVAPGDGQTFPHHDSQLLVTYIGYLPDGTVFDQSPDGATYPISLGSGQNVIGLEVGLMSMSVGQQARVTIPSAVAYGPEGIPDMIPPNSDLVFDLQLLAVDS